MPRLRYGAFLNAIFFSWQKCASMFEYSCRWHLVHSYIGTTNGVYYNRVVDVNWAIGLGVIENLEGFHFTSYMLMTSLHWCMSEEK